MPDKQTLASHSPSGKPDRRPSTDTDTIPRHSQPASASTSSTGSLLDSSADAFSSQPDDQIHSPGGLKSITRMMLVDIPMLWGARLAATACGSRQTASFSQDESEDREVPSPYERGPDIKTEEKTPDSSSGASTAARGYRHHQLEDGSDCYSTLEGDRHWGGAVVDADMFYMRALGDGVHVNYV